MRGSTTQTSHSCGDIQGNLLRRIMLGQISSSKNSRSITEDIAQAETKLRDLRKERAQEVILLFRVFFKCCLPGDPSGGGQRGIAKGSNEALWSSRSTRGESIGSVFFIQHSIYCFRKSFTTVHSHSVFMIKIAQ